MTTSLVSNIDGDALQLGGPLFKLSVWWPKVNLRELSPCSVLHLPKQSSLNLQLLTMLANNGIH